MTPPKKLLTLQEASARLGISRATGDNWLRLGRIQPDAWAENSPLFSSTQVEALVKALQKEGEKRLKRRRNKHYQTGLFPYSSQDKSEELSLFSKKLTALYEKLGPSGPKLRAILTEFSLQQLVRVRRITAPTEVGLLPLYLADQIDTGPFAPMLGALLGKAPSQKQLTALAPLFALSLPYRPWADVLGPLHFSLKDVSHRKAQGSYYTPYPLVKRTVAALQDAYANWRTGPVLDPCCGSGNFLLALLEAGCPITSLYGVDIDPVSIALARLNLATYLPEEDFPLLEGHLTCADWLLTKEPRSYTVYIGNPPWGFRFSTAKLTKLQKKYRCAQQRGAESFSLFCEKALLSLPHGGQMAFVLPESILGVAAHQPVRQCILEKGQITHLTYLGNPFHMVQCPSVILLAKKREQKRFNTIGIKIEKDNRSFIIETERKMDAAAFHLDLNDTEYVILSQMAAVAPQTCLKGQADFALGLVTGDNKAFLHSTPELGDEPIFRGSDIFKYSIGPPSQYISYAPGRFQQAAPEGYYRAPEKLLYRFICGGLAFAYDDKKRLSLNSCNILIPHIPGLTMYYLLALLNCTPMQFYFTKQFRSLKVLRGMLEQLPIPIPLDPVQVEICKHTKTLLSTKDPAERSALFQKIDTFFYSLFGLDETARQYIEQEAGPAAQALFANRS